MKVLDNHNNCASCIYRKILFDSLEPKELALVNLHKIEVEYNKGELIREEGTEINSFLYLKSGLVKLYKHDAKGKDQIISIAKPQDFISLLSIFSNATYVYSIMALADTVVCEVELPILKKVIGQNGTFALEILNKMSKLADGIIENKFTLSKKQLRGRIAYILVYFANHVYHSDSFELPISRKEIAELINMTTENVIRILSEFRKEGIIDIDGKIIAIQQAERLESICKHG